jgi:cytochrome P450
MLYRVTSEIDLEADVLTLFIAGSDTTAIALT